MAGNKKEVKSEIADAVREWKCPYCGGDVGDLCQQYISEKYSAARKRYWRNPSPGHRESARRAAAKGRAAANADKAAQRRRGRDLFKTVGLGKRIEFLNRAHESLRRKRAESPVDDSPEYQRLQERQRRKHRLDAAMKRMDAFGMGGNAGQAHCANPVMISRRPDGSVLRAELIGYVNSETIRAALNGLRYLDGRELFAIWFGEIDTLAVYIDTGCVLMPVCDIYGAEESWAGVFPFKAEWSGEADDSHTCHQ